MVSHPVKRVYFRVDRAEDGLWTVDLPQHVVEALKVVGTGAEMTNTARAIEAYAVLTGLCSTLEGPYCICRQHPERGRFVGIDDLDQARRVLHRAGEVSDELVHTPFPALAAGRRHAP